MTKPTPTLKDRTAKGLLWGLMNSSLMQLLYAVFGIILARKLTDADYGMVAMVSIYSAIAAVLQESGFISALTNRRDATHRDYNSVFWFNILTSAAIYVVLWFAAPLIAAYNHEPQLVLVSRVAFLGFVVAAFSITPRAILFKQMKIKEQTICSVSAQITSGLVGIAMALSGCNYWSIVAQSIVFVLMISLLSWAFSGWRPSLDISFQPVREMFGFSSKLLVTNIFNRINKFAFESVLGSFYTRAVIGQYTQANKWNTMGNQALIDIVNGVAQPMFVQVGDDRERMQRAFRKMLRFTSFIVFPAMFGLCLVSEEFVVCTIREKWLPAVPLLQMLCVGGAFFPIATLYSNFIISRGKSDIFMWSTIAQSLLVLLNIFVVQYFQLQLFGLSGIRLMVVGYVAIAILWTLLWHYFVWREIQLSFATLLVDVIPYLAVAALTMVATHFATRTIPSPYFLLAARILLAAIIYIGILWLAKADIVKESIKYIKK